MGGEAAVDELLEEVGSRGGTRLRHGVEVAELVKAVHAREELVHALRQVVLLLHESAVCVLVGLPCGVGLPGGVPCDLLYHEDGGLFLVAREVPLVVTRVKTELLCVLQD